MLKLLGIVVIAGILVLDLACTSGRRATDTPDIQATIDAAVRATARSQPTPTAAPTLSAIPTFTKAPTAIPTLAPTPVPTPTSTKLPTAPPRLDPTDSTATRPAFIPPIPTVTPVSKTTDIVGAGNQNTRPFIVKSDPWTLWWQVFTSDIVSMGIHLRDASTGDLVAVGVAGGVTSQPTKTPTQLYGHTGEFILEVTGPSLSQGGWRIVIFDGPTAIPTPTPTATSTPAVSAGGTQGCYSTVEDRIDGEFEGFESDRIYVLRNGQIWQQTSYEYAYRYRYSPRVTISPAGGRCVMDVEGMNRTADVVQVEAIQSRINSEFNGLEYERTYTLQNGQIWQQKEFYIWNYYWYAPAVIIYRSHSGPWMMKVEGISHAVRVEQIR